MKPLRMIRVLAVIIILSASQGFLRSAEPIHALLVAGGCCHDYEHQKTILTDGISARANVTWTIVNEGDDRDHMVSIYQKADWYKGYDVVVHDECFGFVTNVEFIERITAAHSNGLPALLIHCSTHSYRMSKTDEWRKLLGVSSFHHENLHAFKVENIKPENPVMKGFPQVWQDFPDELYEIVKVWPDCIPLANGVDDKGVKYPCIWLNTYGKGRVFATTLGHANNTVSSDVYLDLLTRGLLWSCDKLNESGKPVEGYGKKP